MLLLLLLNEEFGIFFCFFCFWMPLSIPKIIIKIQIQTDNTRKQNKKRLFTHTHTQMPLTKSEIKMWILIFEMNLLNNDDYTVNFPNSFIFFWWIVLANDEMNETKKMHNFSFAKAKNLIWWWMTGQHSVFFREKLIHCNEN